MRMRVKVALTLALALALTLTLAPHLRDEISHHLLVGRHEHAERAVEARGGAPLQQLERRGQRHAERRHVEAQVRWAERLA